MHVEDELRLDDQLLEAARSLAREVVAFRQIPVRPSGRKGQKGCKGADIWFRLTQDLQAVPGALPAFDHDDRVIKPAVAAFVRHLHDHPHDAYDDDFSEEAINDHWLAVVDNWTKIRVPGGDALVAAFRQAERAPLELRPPVVAYGRTFTLVVSTAYYLQRHQGACPIWLPVKRLGLLLGYADHTRVSRLLSLARRRGLLAQIEPAARVQIRPGRYERRAALYRFNFDLAGKLYQPPAEGNT